MTAAVGTELRTPRAVPEWHSTAACRAWPELDWIEAKPGSPQAYVCRLVCSVCPERLACALGALVRGEPHGIWGGLDRADRTETAKTYGFPRPGARPDHGTNSRYVKWGCRCADCRGAHAVFERDRRTRARTRYLRAVASPARPIRCDRAKFRRRFKRSKWR